MLARRPPVHLCVVKCHCHYPNENKLDVPIWGRMLSVSALIVLRIAKTSSPFERLESATSLGIGDDIVMRAKAQKRKKTARTRRREEIIFCKGKSGERKLEKTSS